MKYSVAFECAALRRLTGVDCPTSKCRANAYGTGRVLRQDLAGTPIFFVEFTCPDCGLDLPIGSRDVDALANALVAAAPGEREAVAERWTIGRIGDVHPCRPRG